MTPLTSHSNRVGEYRDKSESERRAFKARREALSTQVALRDKFVAVDGDLRSEPKIAPRSSVGRRTRMARGAPRGFRHLPRARKLILSLTWLGLFFMAIYAVTVGVALLRPGYTLADRIGSLALIFGFAFIVVHGVGYSQLGHQGDVGLQRDQKTDVRRIGRAARRLRRRLL